MKRLSLSLLMVLALLALPAPMGQGVATAAPACAADSTAFAMEAPPLGDAAPTAASADSQIALIDQAARLLQDKFFEPVDTATLYAGAIKGANEEFKNQKSDVRIADVSFGSEAARNWGLFYDAYVSAANSAPDLDQKELAYQAIRGMANALNDCHTYFMTPSELEQLQKQMSGNDKRSGLGVVFGTTSDGYPFISDVIPNSPAEKADIRPGDKVLRFGDQDLKGLTASQTASKLRGPAGESITLTFSRPTVPEPFTKTITRAEYEVPVYNVKQLQGGVGYVRIYNFAFTLKKDTFQKIYNQMRDAGAKSLVIDLRDNPGGSAQAAVDLLSAMIPANKPLFSLISRDGTTASYSSVDNLWPDAPQVAILINKSSASASEIVAAVAQDYGVAKVYGTKTEGCVATVTFSKLADGSALGITSSRIDTAKGRRLNRIGVSPDIDVERSNDELAMGYDAPLLAASAYLLGQPMPARPAAAAAAPSTTSAPVTASTAGGASANVAPAVSPTRNDVLSLVPAGTPVQRGSFVLTLEDPAPNAGVAGQMNVTGWAVKTGGTVDEVAVTLDTPDGTSTPLGTAQYGIARPDVAAALGANYLNSGYRLAVDAAKLPAGDHRLTIRVRSGQDVETYTVPVKVGQPSVSPAGPLRPAA